MEHSSKLLFRQFHPDNNPCRRLRDFLAFKPLPTTRRVPVMTPLSRPLSHQVVEILEVIETNFKHLFIAILHFQGKLKLSDTARPKTFHLVLDGRSMCGNDTVQ